MYLLPAEARLVRWSFVQQPLDQDVALHNTLSTRPSHNLPDCMHTLGQFCIEQARWVYRLIRLGGIL